MKWLKENNVFYQNVTICDNLVNQLPEHGIPEIIEQNITYIPEDDEQDNSVPGIDNYVDNGIGIFSEELNIPDLQSAAIITNSPSMSLTVFEKLTKLIDKNHKGQSDGMILSISHGNKMEPELFNPRHMICAFPTLFPYGIGGIQDIRRKKQLSYNDHVSYLLYLNNERFRVHKAFIYCSFNIMQRAEARLNMQLMIKKKIFIRLPSQ